MGRCTSRRSRERKVLRPGVSTLAREVAHIRDRVSQRLWAAIARAPGPVQRERLLGLLAVQEGSRVSELDRLRKGPTTVTAPGLVGALERSDEIQMLGVVDNQALARIAEEADERLRRALEAL